MTTDFRKQVEAALCGYENEVRWDSIGEVTNEGYEFMTYEEAIDAIVKLHEDEVERVIGDDIPQYYEHSEARTSKGIWYEAQQALVNEQRQRAAIEPKKEDN